MEKAQENFGRNSLLVLIAALNEEEGIGHTLAELKEVLKEREPMFLVVDGNSVDRTVEVAKEMGAGILFQEGSGKTDAVAKGISCIDTDVENVVLIDADFTYPATHIPRMIRILEESPDVGMVTGNRFHPDFDLKEAISNVFYFGNRFLAFSHRILNGIALSDPLTGLRVVRWKILKNWVPRSSGFGVEAEMNYYVEKKGYDIVEMPIPYRPRLGEKKLKLRDGLKIFRRMIIESLIS